MKEKTAVFIGHNDCYGLDVDKLYATIQKLIEDNKINTFLVGGMGRFDRICAKTIKELKLVYPHIRCILVIPYIDFKFSIDDYDISEYPECLENVPYKVRIARRNRYMVDSSSVAVCFVNSVCGGAVKTYEYARKQRLHIINLAF